MNLPPSQSDARAELDHRILLGVGLILSALVAVRGPSFIPDSDSYLNHSPFRSVGYQLFLDATRLVGGGGLRFAVFAQGFLAVASAAFFVSKLRAMLGGGRLLTAVSAALLVPAWFACASTIGSECLAFAVFLFGIGKSIDGLLDTDARHFLWAIAAGVGATLVRPQFVFVWPVLLLIAILRIAAGKLSLRSAIMALGILFLGSGIQRTYDAVLGRSPDRGGLTGIQLATEGFYLASAADASAVGNPADAVLAKTIVDRLSVKQLLANNRPSQYPAPMYLSMVYNDICWKTIVSAIADRDRVPVSSIDWGSADPQTKRLGLFLIRRHLRQYVVQVVSTMIWYSRYYIFLVAGIVAVGLARLRECEDKSLAIGFFLSLLWFSNLILICMIEAPMSRYTFYTDSVLCVWIVAALATRSSGRALPV